MIALRAARLFDGEQLVANPVVVIDGDRVVSVGVDPPADAEVIDLADATLLPGLVDCHQHLVFCCEGTLEEQVAGLSDDDLRERARANARKALVAGVTTIRDLGDKDYVTLALRDDPSLPTILCAGPPLTVVNGHCWYLGGECAPDAIGDAVREHKERGCDVIKVMVSGGHLTPTYPMHQSQFTTDEINELVDTAHAVGLPVAAHCHGVDSIVSAIDAGVDTIEHCSFMSEDLTVHPVEDVLQAMVDKGIAMSATLGTLPGMDPPPVIKANLGALIAAIGGFHRMGGVLVAGTDAGIGPPKQHDVLPHAVAHFDQMELDRADTMRALTSRGAQVVGLGDRKGRLQAGYDADVLAVAGNPLGDGDLLTPLGVWRAGVRVR